MFHNNLVDVLRFLLSHGADVNARDGAFRSALHLVDYEDLEVAQVLLKHNADVNSQDDGGMTPLHMLLYGWTKNEGYVLNCTLLLLKYGADVNKRDKDNQTPLHLAIRRDMLKIAGSLLAQGADVNLENNYGETPLQTFSGGWIYDKGDALNFTLLLLKHGAEVNRTDKDNQTPLHLALRQGWFKVAGSLVAHGADVNSESNDGKTPLRILSESRINNEGDILRLALLLLKHGAEPNMDNQASFQVEIRQHYFKIAAILLEDGLQGTDVSAEKEKGKNPLCILSESRIYDEGDFVNHTLLFLNHGVGVSQQEEGNKGRSIRGIGRGK